MATLDEILAYVAETPGNTNPAVLATLIGEGGGGDANAVASLCPITFAISGTTGCCLGAAYGYEWIPGDDSLYGIEPLDYLEISPETPRTIPLVSPIVQEENLFYGWIGFLIDTEPAEEPTISWPQKMVVVAKGAVDYGWIYYVECQGLVPGTTYTIQVSSGSGGADS